MSRPPRTLGGGIQCQSTLCFPSSAIGQFHLKRDPLAFDISTGRKRSPELQVARPKLKAGQGPTLSSAKECCATEGIPPVLLGSH
jgi:hypothetical protein